MDERHYRLDMLRNGGGGGGSLNSKGVLQLSRSPATVPAGEARAACSEGCVVAE